ncbi:MAG TPA: M20/M25/M40 family metallo-hydrolase [Chakrabartia sp.]|nr:M20/M25/M40 family metallo-hydrolase [Chakrabartia sp.]
MIMRKPVLALSLLAMASATQAQTALRPDQAAFRELYKELVETNTSYSGKGCTKAADQLATRLKAAGFAGSDVQVLEAPGHPGEGSLVAVLKGTSKSLKPMLLLGHIDVVEAKREDWTRDPYTLIEEGGYFYARGTADDKAMSAMWADSLIRFKQQGYAPKRTIKMALTCGEESNGIALNGAQWLAENRPELISAAFALNEGGGGRTEKDGTRSMLAIQVGEKATRTFVLETTNPGGHSSVPRPDNAIADLARAVTAVQSLRFPVMLNDTTRAFFSQLAPARPKPGQDMIARLLANEQDDEAAMALSAEPVLNSTMRTTCVTTMLNAGHAPNALPQRARATVNCRIVPGMSAEQTQQGIEKAIANPSVKVTLETPFRPMAVQPPMDPKLIGPMKELAAKMFPGVPLIPTMVTGATDATYTGLIGIPTYGVPGIFGDVDGNGAHGLNERIRVQSVYEGRDYLHSLVKTLSSR